ncbi:hypothetical protein CUJ83_07440 [Methanocella sp. CWC-04]|uniref:Uncharacterized protein n=1 Tax=Methanooceanicella nereidis TaxID=2052831 RepID=A0AAP2RDK4_9EURY|nr:hypothetical protein [Methanocella sp. CWC-04]MCD1294831.1 hypothetical protein [Methanocella sp. CWC-04]
MRVNDRVVLLRELKGSLGGDVIPEGSEGVILYKITGSGRNTFEVDFGSYGVAICEKNDIEIVR